MTALKIVTLLLIFIALIVLLFIVVETKLSTQPKYHPGGPYYYKSWVSYIKPFRPFNEISKSEAAELKKKGHTYYEAFFNENGLITKFIEHRNYQISFEESYTYEDGKIKDTVMKKNSVDDSKE